MSAPSNPEPKKKNQGCAVALAAALMWIAVVVVYFRAHEFSALVNQARAYMAQAYTGITRPAADNGSKRLHDTIPIPPDIKKLPGIAGWGNVPSMHQVMATDGGRLRALVELYVASEPKEARKMVWNIIFAWTGMTDIDPASYPQYKGDARKLFAMEALSGRRFGTNSDGTFTPPHLTPIWRSIMKGGATRSIPTFFSVPNTGLSTSLPSTGAERRGRIPMPR